MSIHVISSVLNCRDPQLSSSRRMVLVVLANYASEHGHSWPSQKTIADESGAGERSIRDHLKWLEDNEFISRHTKRLGQGKGSRTTYLISLQKLRETAGFKPANFAPAESAGAIRPAESVTCGGSIPPITNRQEPLISSVVLTRARCFEAAGLKEADAMNSPGLVSTVDIERLLRDPKHPCDLELDVIPAIQSCAASLRNKGSTLANWSYCRAAILRNRDQRLAGNPAPTKQPAAANGAPASRQKHGGGGVVAASLRLAAKLRESRGVDDDHGSEAEPINAGGLAEVFSNNRRVAGPG
jgi:hypothetical protein